MKENAPSKKTAMINFLIGGIAGMSTTCIIQPVDIIKVRIQVRSEQRHLHPHKK
jgi:hypothetical protein